MNARISVAIFVLIVYLRASRAEESDSKDQQPKQWALLVAGSNYWYNYRHQADICHAYQVLHAHGIPDENIVVMMYDDIANNTANPTPGIILNNPNGSDVYHGVPKDYVGREVNPKNFINVLTGNQKAMANIGSGKVIASGPNDHVFVNFDDHGAPGVLGFPTSELTVKQLNDAITQMYNEKRYGKLVFYIEACNAGSMFSDTLPNNISVYATTASNPDESSYAIYYDPVRATYLGDEYSVNWMEDSDAENIENESLEGQFGIVKNLTVDSHVMEYGDLTVSDLAVGQFQGPKEDPLKPSLPKPDHEFERGVSSREVPMDILYKKLAAAMTTEKKEELRKQMDEMLEKRSYLETTVKKIVGRVARSFEHEEQLTSATPKKLTQLDCHHDLIKAFSRNCFNFGKNPYALKYAYILANMCEQGLNAGEVIRTMRQVCKSIVPVEYGIH